MSSPNVSTGINLALDPNLLSLQKDPPQSTSPTSFTGSPTTNESTTTNTVETTEQNKIGSLVNNPYEQYGNMPLSQVVPLILQQKQMTFAQLLESQIEEEITVVQSSEVDPIETDDGILKDEEKEQDEQDQPMIAPTEPIANKIITTTQEPTDSTTLESIRSTMVEQINTAMNESSLALETVSLLLSAVRENNAKSSLSPYLKRTIPMGSLNSDRVNNPPDIDNQLRTVQFGVGWKLKSLDDSRTVLRDTADSLWSILAKEHSYWKMISEVITNSDVVFKVRERGSAQRVLGIKYGYEDSGSTYRLDRGVALLRNNEELDKLELVPFNGETSRVNGSSTIHSKSKNSNNTNTGGIKNMISGMNGTPAVTVPTINPIDNISNDGGSSHQLMKYFLRVRIFTKLEYEDDYILSGESHVDPKFFSIGTIRSQIHKFKDIIFEKELMYRLKKECSSLISYGVRIENENKIAIELPQEKFEIELVSVAEDECEGGSLPDGGNATRINDKRANLILITLRVLLVVMFKKNLKRQLLSGHVKKLNSINGIDGILLIRPILGTLRHKNYKTLLLRIIRENVLDVIKDSSITVTKRRDTTTTKSDKSVQQDEHIERLDEDIKVFNQILKMPVTQLDITLPKEQSLRVTLRTTNYCNAVIHVVYTEKGDEVLFDTTFTEFKEIEEFLHFLISEYVISNEEST